MSSAPHGPDHFLTVAHALHRLRAAEREGDSAEGLSAMKTLLPVGGGSGLGFRV